jgi:hypothetical protein
MKRLLSVFAALGLVLSLGPVAQAAGNPPIRTVIHFDGTGSDLQGCSGESMSLVGDIVITSHAVADGNGGQHVLEQVVFKNFTATGLVSGDVYREVGASHLALNTTAGATTVVISGMFQLTGSAPDDFIMIIVELNITNANGELVVFPGSGAIRFGCK